MLQTTVIAVSLALSLVTIYLVVKAVRSMVGVLGIGQPVSRSDAPGKRTLTMLKETFLHTRMFQWRWVGVMHWFVYFGFLILASAVATGFVQLFKPEWQIWWIGHWFVFEWIQEAIGVLSTVGILFLIVYRQLHKPQQLGRRSRFFGSTFWQAYFVEYMALLEGVAILFIRGAERKLEILDGHADRAGAFHYPIAQFLSGLYGDSETAIKNAIWVIAFIKVASALVWLDVVASHLTMGIAWHRFTAWFNIWFKREAQGRDTDGTTLALGAMKPLTSAGKTITLDDIEDLDEDTTLGAGAISDFSWKGILDFTTCTECGRCQSQCPAWNTQKPLSPKHLVMSLRDHAYAAAPYIQSGHTEGTVAEKALIGKTDHDAAAGAGEEVLDWFYNPADGEFVMDEDVLWSCTSCGACVQQCPVDIEHVDHIMDMRRYQVLVESNFPSELNQLFKGLENKGNPWNMSANARMDWAKDLPFEVKEVGKDIESLDEVDWLFWVGCAGAYEDRAKKTTRAVAELLDMAGVSFGVLGNGETCTGDPARRAGNEFVFQGLAQQNVETFKEFKVKKAVTTCAHCFNTLKNEYKEFGIELEVVHHTQLLNRLVREGKLTPVADGAGAHQRSITYHDPCYIGRHNGVYTAPRELLQILPGAEYKEMPRNSERSFCCGAGGARMWMEEKLGERINLNRTNEAVATGADQIAVGCPFCRVMLSDGLTAVQAKGEAREEVEVLDVAQMLLASVKGEMATKMAPGAGGATATKVATAAEPSAGDVTSSGDTITKTADAGPAAKATETAGTAGADSGSSLFDTPAPAESAPTDDRAGQGTGAPDDASSLFDTPAPAESGSAGEAKPAGGSLFDEGGSLFDTPPEAPAESGSDRATEAASGAPAGATTPETPAETEAKAQPEGGLGGGSLFDIPADEPVADTAAPADAAQPEGTPETATDTGSSEPSAPGGSAPAEGARAEGAPAEGAPAEGAPPETEAPATPEPSVDLGAGGSLFDIPAAEPESAPQAAAPEPTVPESTAPESTAPESTAPESSEPHSTEPESTGPAVPTSADRAGDSGEAAAPAGEPPAGTGAASAPRSDVDIAGASSLFDIEAPEGATSAAPAAEPASPAPSGDAQATDTASSTVASAPATETAASTEPTTEAEQTGAEAQSTGPEAESTGPEAESTGAGQAGERQSTAEDSTATPGAGAEETEAASEQSQGDVPPSSGERHTPRTDVDINTSGSLFDL